jgi:uncharacterized protein (DUF433 family)
MADMTQFTAAEAAFVLREPIRAVKKALDLGPVRPSLQRGSAASVRVIDWVDLFYLFAVRALREDLTPWARGEFHAALRRAWPECGDEVRFGRFRVAVADLVDEVKKRIAELAALRGSVGFAEDGRAILGCRGVEVHRIAALLNGGLSVDAVLEEYPFLSRAAVENAWTYARACPKAGRAYPRTTANRTGRDTSLEPPDEVPLDDVDGR